jgi:hypothetical protein
VPGSYTTGTKLWKPSYLEQGWGDLVDANFDRLSELTLNVKSFGVLGDDVADDTTALNNAYITAAAQGAAVYWPPGSYRTSAPINCHGTAGSSAKGVRTIFAGREGIVRIKPLTDFAGPVLNCSPTTASASPSWSFENVYIDNALAPSNTGIYLNNVQLLRVVDCKFRLGTVGLDIGIVSAANFYGLDAYNQTTAGFRYAAGTTTNSQGHNWKGCTFFYTAGASGDGNAGWLDLSGHQDQWYDTCTVIRTPGISYKLPYGFKLDGTGAGAPGQSWFTNCEADAVGDGNNPGTGATGAGFWFKNITHVRMNTCWVSALDTTLTWRMPAIYIDQCTDVSLDNNYISGTGITVGATSVTDFLAVRGNHFSNASASDPCITGVANVTNLMVPPGNTKRLTTATWFDSHSTAQTASNRRLTDEQIVRRTTDSAVKNDSTLADDTQLTINVDANQIWFVEAYAVVAAANVTMDVKFAWTIPSGTTGYHGALNGASSQGGWNSVNAGTTAVILATNLGASLSYGTFAGTSGVAHGGLFVVGATAGAITLRWAQQTTDAGNLQLLTNSFLRAKRIG